MAACVIEHSNIHGGTSVTCYAPGWNIDQGALLILCWWQSFCVILYKRTPEGKLQHSLKNVVLNICLSNVS